MMRFFGKYNPMKKIMSFAIGAVLLCSSFAGCNAKGNAGQEVPAETTVKIGVILDMSSEEKKEESTQLYNAVCMAVDEINAAGGVLTDNRKLAVILKDDQGVELNAAGAYYQLVEEGATCVIGTNTQAAIKTLANITYASTVPLLMPMTSDDSYVSVGDFNFETCLNDSYMAKSIAYYAKYNMGCDSVAIIYNPLNVDSKLNYDVFLGAANADDLNVTYAGAFVDEEGIKKAFEDIVSRKCSAVYLPLLDDDTLKTVYKIANEAGYEGDFLGNQSYAKLGTDYGYKMYVPVDMAWDNVKYQAFLNEFCGKYGTSKEDVISYVRPAYEAVYYVRDAIEKAYETKASSVMMKLVFMENSTDYFGDYAIGAYGATTKSVDIVCVSQNTGSYVDTIFE